MKAISAATDPWGEAGVTGNMLGCGKALDIAEFKDEDDGNEGTDAGNGCQALDRGIVCPTLCELIVDASTVRASRIGRGRLKVREVVAGDHLRFSPFDRRQAGRSSGTTSGTP